MIRIAFLGVLAIAGLLAFGAFFLARGTQAVVVEQAETAAPPTAAATPEVDRLFFLGGIDFDQGDITLMLFGTGDGPVIVRDQTVLRAAADKAYVNTKTTNGQAAGSFALALLGAPPTETFAQIYRNDRLIASVSCTNTACGSFADRPDINYAGLLDHAVPFTRIRDEFNDYDAYLATIADVDATTDFEMLDMRPSEDFPAARRATYMILALPSVVVPAQDPLDLAAHEARVRDALAPHLSDGMTVDWVRIGPAVNAALADMDNNQVVPVNGQSVPFPDANFHTVRARINGTLSLPTSAYDAITGATLRQFDVDAGFAEFVTGTLPTTCVDCYFLKVDGEFDTQTRLHDWRSEFYMLDYYDLRDAP